MNSQSYAKQTHAWTDPLIISDSANRVAEETFAAAYNNPNVQSW